MSIFLRPAKRPLLIPCRASQIMSDQAENPVKRLRRACQAAFDDTPVFLVYTHGSRVDGAPRPCPTNRER